MQPPNESLSQGEPPVTKLVGDFYATAYSRQINGENPIDVSMGLGGRVETIALNPKNERVIGDNVRFLVSTGSLDFKGFSMDIGDREMDVKHIIIKITLSRDDKRPIEELVPEELSLTTMLFINDEGRVSTVTDWLTDEETVALSSSMGACELAPTIPEWVQDSPD